MTAVPDLSHFDHHTAWTLGSALVEHSRREHLGVTIAIWIGNQRVFHAALPGTSTDNDHWVERKANIVRHFATSTADVHDTYVHDDAETFLRLFALPINRYFPAGGAIPITVRGTMIGVLAISGLPETEDHDLAVEHLAKLTAEQP